MILKLNRLTGTFWKFLSISIVALLVLTGCTGGAESTPPAPTSGAAQAPLVTETAPLLSATLPSVTVSPSAENTTGTTGVQEAPAVAATAAPAQPTTLPDASALPDPSGYEWKEVAFGFERPISMATARDQSGRLFIVEKRGVIRILRGNQAAPQPFLDITDRVGSSSSEQGLLGLDFDPNYTTNGRFYVNYTDRNGDTVISRFNVSADPDVADPGSEVVLITQDQPYPNHNGGQVAFGPDGYLYLGLGDGGSAGDPNNNAQSLDTLLGKILRIDVSGDAYTIPADNPFPGGKNRPEIWAYGLRNPWRFSFDLKTDDLMIADVGQNQWEEINYVPAGSPAGLNFGWRYFEGTHPFEGQPPADAELVRPVYEYDHSQGCSVTGGYVYRGAMPEWQGVYLFADYCSGNVWGLLQSAEGWQGKILFPLRDIAVPTFGQDEQGEVYMVLMNGQILRLQAK